MSNPWIVICPNCKKEHEAAEVIHCDCGMHGGKGSGFIGKRMGFVWHWQKAVEQSFAPDAAKSWRCQCGFSNHGLSQVCINCETPRR